MKLYLFRHAEAEDLGKGGTFLDEQRQLTEKGRADAKKMGAYLKQKQRKINLILHSPLLRAVQTAEILAVEWGGELKAVAELSTDYGMRTYLEVIGKFKNIEHLALVGHQPTLTKVISTLISGEHNALFRFEPCSLAVVRIGATLIGGELELLLSPNDLP